MVYKFYKQTEFINDWSSSSCTIINICRRKDPMFEIEEDDEYSLSCLDEIIKYDFRERYYPFEIGGEIEVSYELLQNFWLNAYEKKNPVIEKIINYFDENKDEEFLSLYME